MFAALLNFIKQLFKGNPSSWERFYERNKKYNGSLLKTDDCPKGKLIWIHPDKTIGIAADNYWIDKFEETEDYVRIDYISRPTMYYCGPQTRGYVLITKNKNKH